MSFLKLLASLSVALSLTLTGCSEPAPPEDPGPFHVLLSSETSFLQPILEEATRDTGVSVEIKTGAGTLRLAESLNKTDNAAPDAIILTGDGWRPDTIGANQVTDASTIAWSPVVLGMKPGSVAQPTLSVSELRTLVSANPKKVMAARGDASDASILFWIGALSAQAGGGTIQEWDIRRPELETAFRSLVENIWQIDEMTAPLTSQALVAMDRLKGIITYEATLRQINLRLLDAKKPELIAVRIRGGTLSGTVTVAFIGNSPVKRKVYHAMVGALRDPRHQKAIQASGWLTAPPADVLTTPMKGTLWATRRRFERFNPKLAVQTRPVR